jgi:hypothetical protein
MVAPHGRLLRRCWKRVDACCASSATITAKRVQLAIATRLRSALSVIAQWLCTGISSDNLRRLRAVCTHQPLRRQQRLQTPQSPAVIKEAKGTLRVVAQAALHIPPARPPRQQLRQVQTLDGRQIPQPLERGAPCSEASSPVAQ